MKIEIHNRFSKGAVAAAEFLERNKSRLPSFRRTSIRTYNGIVIEVDDDDAEDMLYAIAMAGYVCSNEEP